MEVKIREGDLENSETFLKIRFYAPLSSLNFYEFKIYPNTNNFFLFLDFMLNNIRQAINLSNHVEIVTEDRDTALTR